MFERAKIIIWTLTVFLLLLFFMAIIFSGQLGFSSSLKGSMVIGMMLTFIFASTFILYELVLIIVKMSRKNRNSGS